MTAGAAALLLATALALAACSADDQTRTAAARTVTRTVTTTATETVSAGLPAPVERTRAAVLRAAEAGDYDVLAELADDREFSYTFGGPVEGGPAAYWRRLEREGAERPAKTLAAILRMPYALFHGVYVWPFAFTADPKELTAYERRLLAPIAGREEIRAWRDIGGYLGWRAGITPDGRWIFFIAGD